MEPFSAFDPYGGERAPATLGGYLLVATPAVEDPNFSRRVILMLDHGDQGALGVVIDRPGGVAVEQLMPRWHALATPPAELFTGGPVARNALIGLVRLSVETRPATDRAWRPTGWRLLVDADAPGGHHRPVVGPLGPGRVDRRGPAVLRIRRVGLGSAGGGDRGGFVVRGAGRGPGPDLGRSRGPVAAGPPTPGRRARAGLGGLSRRTRP